MEDNSDCATSIFSLALFSPFVWLFAIIIIFLHLARANPRRMCSCLAYWLRGLDQRGEWIMRKMDGKREAREESRVLSDLLVDNDGGNRARSKN